MEDIEKILVKKRKEIRGFVLMEQKDVSFIYSAMLHMIKKIERLECLIKKN